MNRITLTDDERFLQVWSNGTVCLHVPVLGGIEAFKEGLKRCQEYSKEWSGSEAELSKEVALIAQIIES